MTDTIRKMKHDDPKNDLEHGEISGCCTSSLALPNCSVLLRPEEHHFFWSISAHGSKHQRPTVCLSGHLSFFPGILLSGKPADSQGKRRVIAKNDG